MIRLALFSVKKMDIVAFPGKMRKVVTDHVQTFLTAQSQRNVSRISHIMNVNKCITVVKMHMTHLIVILRAQQGTAKAVQQAQVAF